MDCIRWYSQHAYCVCIKIVRSRCGDVRSQSLAQQRVCGCKWILDWLRSRLEVCFASDSALRVFSLVAIGAPIAGHVRFNVHNVQYNVCSLWQWRSVRFSNFVSHQLRLHRCSGQFVCCYCRCMSRLRRSTVVTRVGKRTSTSTTWRSICARTLRITHMCAMCVMPAFRSVRIWIATWSFMYVFFVCDYALFVSKVFYDAFRLLPEVSCRKCDAGKAS